MRFLLDTIFQWIASILLDLLGQIGKNFKPLISLQLSMIETQGFQIWSQCLSWFSFEWRTHNYENQHEMTKLSMNPYCKFPYDAKCIPTYLTLCKWTVPLYTHPGEYPNMLNTQFSTGKLTGRSHYQTTVCPTYIGTIITSTEANLTID